MMHAENNVICKVSVKIPPIWRKNIATWKMQIDAQFACCNITAEATKFNYVLAALDCETADLISDFLTSERTATPYTDLINRLSREFQESESRKITRLLSELDLGDKKPSQLLREMRSLAGNQVKDDFLKTIYLQRLPANLRTIVASSSDTLDNLAEMADRILDYSNSTSFVCSTQSAHLVEPSLITQPDRLSNIEGQVAELTSTINSLLLPRFRARSRSRSSQARGYSNSLCWYHQNFGNRARKCVSPCSFASKSTHQSENQ